MQRPVIPWTPLEMGTPNLPEQPLSVPDHPLHEEIPADVPPDPPLAQLEAMSLCPVTHPYHGMQHYPCSSALHGSMVLELIIFQLLGRARIRAIIKAEFCF